MKDNNGSETALRLISEITVQEAAWRDNTRTGNTSTYWNNSKFGSCNWRDQEEV